MPPVPALLQPARLVPVIPGRYVLLQSPSIRLTVGEVSKANSSCANDNWLHGWLLVLTQSRSTDSRCSLIAAVRSDKACAACRLGEIVSGESSRRSSRGDCHRTLRALRAAPPPRSGERAQR